MFVLGCNLTNIILIGPCFMVQDHLYNQVTPFNALLKENQSYLSDYFTYEHSLYVGPIYQL